MIRSGKAFATVARQRRRVHGEEHSSNDIYTGREEREEMVSHVLLLEFVSSSSDLSDPAMLCAQLASIHLRSESPSGKSGFRTGNCQYGFPQRIKWDVSWAKVFTELISGFFNFDTKCSGPWPEYEEVFNRLIVHTVPRLLERLQSNCLVLKPCLLHGNLSRENITSELADGNPVSFSPSDLYAHHEYELGIWRQRRGAIDWSFFKQYLDHFRPSDPVEEWDDQLRLYSLKFNLAYSIGWPETALVRKQ